MNIDPLTLTWDIHRHRGIDKGESVEKQQNFYTDQQLEEIVDLLLQSMDINKDGFIEYTEYRKNMIN